MISLIHPSRGRPEQALKATRDWSFAAGSSDFEHILSLDDGDTEYYKYIMYFAPSEIVKGPNNSVVEATNRAAMVADGDILIYMSDDFKCPENWIELVTKEFAKYSGPTLIKVDDCLQKFHFPVLTIPIMNRELYNKLGYFFHPDYKSMFCDEHLYWKTMQLGALKFAPHLKFEHCHVSVGKAPDDETYRRSAANWEQGKAMFAKHKRAGFP